MITVLSDLVHSIGKRADSASATGSAQAKLKQLLTDLGLQADAASPTGSANAKLAKLLHSTTSAPIVKPDLAAGVAAVAGGGAWTYGAWAQIIAASSLTGHALMQIHVQANNTTAARQFQIQVGQGGAGAEVGLGEFATDNVTGAGPGVVIPVYPLLKITANARVAVRCASDTAGSQMTVKLVFIPVPLT